MPELAAKYGVSMSTIIRDVSYLSSLAPIYTKNGKNGGVFILATREHRNWLSDEEIIFLNSLVDLVDNHGKRILRNIIDKFSHISPFDLLCSNLCYKESARGKCRRSIGKTDTFRHIRAKWKMRGDPCVKIIPDAKRSGNITSRIQLCKLWATTVCRDNDTSAKSQSERIAQSARPPQAR